MEKQNELIDKLTTINQKLKDQLDKQQQCMEDLQKQRHEDIND